MFVVRYCINKINTAGRSYKVPLACSTADIEFVNETLTISGNRSWKLTHGIMKVAFLWVIELCHALKLNRICSSKVNR